MVISVRLSKPAADKLDSIKRWYQQAGAGRAAARRLQAIIATIECLEFFPFLGKPDAAAATRELACQDHRVIYEILDVDNDKGATEIVILQIFGPGEE